MKVSTLMPASRLGFFIGTILVNAAVFVGCWLVGTHLLFFSPKLIAFTGVGTQLALIRKRESDIQPKRRWRFWYTAAVALLTLIWVAGTSGIGAEDRIRVVSQVVLGGFLVFQIFILPITVWGSIRKASLAR